MKTIALAATALNQTPLAWESNAANIRGAIADAGAAGVIVVCLPELSISAMAVRMRFFRRTPMNARGHARSA